MLKNYFKLAIKVLARRKFFTFISLFGISFTLMILMVTTAFLDNELGDAPPLTEKDKMVLLNRVTMKKMEKDTIPQVDSTMIDGQMRYDTTYTYDNRASSISTSSASLPFLEDQIGEVDGAVLQTYFVTMANFDVFINNKKLALDAIYSDAAYWQVFDFKLLEGRTYLPTAVKNQEQVVVITDKTARAYFGREKEVLGEFMNLEGKDYEVVGVVKAPTRSFDDVQADLYLPYTNMAGNMLASESFLGPFKAVFLAESSQNRDRIKSAIKRKAELISMPKPEEYNQLELWPMTFAEAYAKGVKYEEDPRKSYNIVFGAIVGLLLLFVLLPTLNLVNVNTSRILERASEIGVRKAFGANSGNILFQFVFENIILTFIGGVLGFLLALVLIMVINDSQALGEVVLQFNLSVFLYSLLIILVFGILSGIIPAWRMSKLQIANALKQNQL
ncbi:MAG TPA: ABC transporter permease [Saprospiraceae bacterium]|nr:ABC transporter permease [Saprospiraceae bacterium]